MSICLSHFVCAVPCCLYLDLLLRLLHFLSLSLSPPLSLLCLWLCIMFPLSHSLSLSHLWAGGGAAADIIASKGSAEGFGLAPVVAAFVCTVRGGTFEPRMFVMGSGSGC